MTCLLACLLAVLLLQVHSQDSPLLHVPFETSDRLSPSSLFERYPEMLISLQPDVLAWRIAQMPLLLKQILHLTTVTVLNRQIAMRCYATDSCPYNKEFRELIGSFVELRPQVRYLYAIFVSRDEISTRWIR